MIQAGIQILAIFNRIRKLKDQFITCSCNLVIKRLTNSYKIMDWLIETLQKYPSMAIFLTIALGFYIGKFKYKSFSLGSVTSVLLVGIVIGQANISISNDLKQIFFLIFLFAVGYSVGPQFINSLKKSGIPQLTLTFVMCSLGLVITYILASLAGYNPGQAAGLLAGSQAISAVIGVGTDTINSLSISDQDKHNMIVAIPVCYAVTYLFGTLGSVILLAQVGPLFWGGLQKVRQACRKMEMDLGVGSEQNHTMISPFSSIVFRAYNITQDSVAIGKTAHELEKYFLDKGYHIYIDKYRIKHSHIVDSVRDDYRFQLHDDIVMQGRGEFVISEMKEIGKEIFDRKLLDFQVKSMKVLVISKEFAGKTFKELSHYDFRLKVSVQKVTRGGIELPLFSGNKLQHGDMVHLIGPKDEVEKAVKLLGYPDVETESTDMISLGFGILLGGLIGLLAINIGRVELSLSISGGTLIAGLFFGWLRSKHPTFAQIPEPSLWLMNTLGLNAFIAVVGITAAPGFIDGFKEVGIELVLVGVLATSLPVLIGIIMARYIFKFHPGLGLGSCCGARTTTAGLSAVEDALNSRIPALGYTVTYAVGNTLLIISGIIIVFLMA